MFENVEIDRRRHKKLLLPDELREGMKYSSRRFLEVEKALEESKELNQNFIELSPDGIFVACEGKIVFVNPAFIKMMGAKEEKDLVGMDMFDVIHDDFKNIVQDRIRMGQEQYVTCEIIEEKYIRLDGRELFVEVTARPFIYQGKKSGLIIVRDIGMRKLMATELQKHQDHLEELVKEKTINLKNVIDKLSVESTVRNLTLVNLQESEARFAAIFRESQDGMAIFSLKDGCLVDINASFTRITGFERNEVMSFSFEEIRGLVDTSGFKRILDDGVARDLEIHFKNKKGEYRLGLLSGQIIKINNKESIFFSFRDITDYKKMEKEILRFDQLNLVGEMAAGIAHEIRNPMTTVRGFLQMFSQKKDYFADKEFFDLMIDELDRANIIISEFLSLAKGRIVEFKLQNINKIIKKITPLIWSDAMVFGSNVEFKLRKVTDIFIDEKEIRQLILNLSRNGLEAMPNRGTLTIRTYEENEVVFLEISDEGTGITSEVLDKLGTPFITTKEKGTGLGLAVCYSIATRHDAKIMVETSPKGTKFIVNFKAVRKK